MFSKQKDANQTERRQQRFGYSYTNPLKPFLKSWLRNDVKFLGHRSYKNSYK